MKLAIKVGAVLAAAFFSIGMHAQSTPSDPQIVGAVIGANQIDINYAKLALSKTKNADVKAFAQQMETDHAALEKSVKDLAAKLKVKPEDSDLSKSLSKQATDETAALKKLSGPAFDKAYIDNEVSYHKAVIGAVSTVLIPNAKNAELKSALTGAAPLFQGHLEHAQHVQATLAGGK